MGGAARATSGRLPTCSDPDSPNNDAVQLKSNEERSAKPAAAPRGFTLIELMIVVTVIAVLALIGYPLFVKQVNKSRRAEAISLMSRVAQAQERWRANNASFDNDFGTTRLNVRSTAPSGVFSLNETYYTVTINGNDSTNYNVRAVATGSQATDTSCAAMELRMANGNLSYWAGPTVGSLANSADDANARQCWNR
jgi:type IV pilus assembly protein PilE